MPAMCNTPACMATMALVCTLGVQWACEGKLFHTSAYPPGSGSLKKIQRDCQRLPHPYDSILAGVTNVAREAEQADTVRHFRC